MCLGKGCMVPRIIPSYNRSMRNDSSKSDYYKTLFKLMVPITVQQLFNSGLGLVDNMLVGQLGETAVAAVSLGYQVYFVLFIFYFGVNTGSAIFAAQFWGNNDPHSIRKVLGLNLIINLTIGVIFTTVAQLIPEKVIGIYTNDPAVIVLGARYLRTYSFSYIIMGFSYGIFNILRSTENVRIPMIVNSCALIVNTSLGFILIFGHLGFQPQGILGSAYAAITARILEFATIIIILFASHSYLVRELKQIFDIKKEFLIRFMRTTLPVAVNELVWSVGVTTYSAIYAHISTEAVAATNIAGSIENLAFVPFIGLGNAAAIMIGKRIGAGEEHTAQDIAKRSLTLAIMGGLGMGAVMYLNRGWLLDIYKVSELTHHNANLVISLLSLVMAGKAWNMVIFIGVLRSGGDTSRALLIEMSTMWLYGVPFAWVGANLLHFPIEYVVALVASEEIIKGVIVFFRFRSGKWIHNLVHTAA